MIPKRICFTSVPFRPTPPSLPSFSITSGLRPASRLSLAVHPTAREGREEVGRRQLNGCGGGRKELTTIERPVRMIARVVWDRSVNGRCLKVLKVTMMMVPRWPCLALAGWRRWVLPICPSGSAKVVPQFVEKSLIARKSKGPLLSCCKLSFV